MKTRLFNEHESLTVEGSDLMDRIEVLIEPEIEKMFNEGYSLRDVELVVSSVTKQSISRYILRAGLAARRANRLRNEPL